MVLVSDTWACHDDHLCQIIFKSHHVRLSYGPDTILEHTHTRTGYTLYAVPPFHGGGIKTRLFNENPVFETVKLKMTISLFETVRLAVLISPRNLYN